MWMGRARPARSERGPRNDASATGCSGSDGSTSGPSAAMATASASPDAVRRGLRELLAGSGLTHHRLSIDWARIEPEQGQRDPGGRRPLPRRADGRPRRRHRAVGVPPPLHAAAVASTSGRAAAPVGRVLPGVDLADSVVGDTGVDDRRQLFDAIAQLLVGSGRLWSRRSTTCTGAIRTRSTSSKRSCVTATGGDRPMLFVGTVREEELVDRRYCGRRSTRLHSAAEAASRVDLGRLDATSSAEIVAWIISAMSPVTLARIVEAAAGNPLFLVEMSRIAIITGASTSPCRPGCKRSSTHGSISCPSPPPSSGGPRPPSSDGRSPSTSSAGSIAEPIVVTGTSTSCGDAGSSASAGSTATTSPTTASAMSPTDASGRPTAAACTGRSPRRCRNSAASRPRSPTTASVPAEVDSAIAAHRLAVDAAVRAFATRT